MLVLHNGHMERGVLKCRIVWNNMHWPYHHSLVIYTVEGIITVSGFEYFGPPQVQNIHCCLIENERFLISLY